MQLSRSRGSSDAALRKQAEVLLVRSLQQEAYAKERELVARKQSLPRTSALAKLNPVLDEKGLLLVGGRLTQAVDLSRDERHPIIIPGSQHLALLLVRHLHQQVKHQGRHFTRGHVRASGYWIVGEKRLVNRVIHACVECKRLRSKSVEQKMADLPAQRVTAAPPFSHVGVDVFGPWQVLTRRTRGGVAQAKRWAVMFTCLAVRAIHIEIVEAMDTSSFINALRRFLALRGHVTRFYSDCGTNFVGAQGELQTALGEMDKKQIEIYMSQKGTEWVFNPPHASHMGGAWERMIGIARRVIDAMLQELPTKLLTHETLTTLMAEVSAIVNNRPLTPVSNDPEAPEILTPSMILTHKTLPSLPPPGKFTPNDLHIAQWRQVQYLANVFWARWKKEFLPLLQTRRKWVKEYPNLRVGDLVLLKNQELHRNEWPRGLVAQVFPGKDGNVRRIAVTITRGGATRTYTRPITEAILLVTADKLQKQ